MPHKDITARRAYRRRYERENRARLNEGIRERRRRNMVYVNAINVVTVCAHCGAQPIEWHNPEHVELGRQIYRISHLVGNASLATISAEMARCTPLCRRCHMREDGRLRKFIDSVGARGRRTPPQLCEKCGVEVKPRWRGMCRQCYDLGRRLAGQTTWHRQRAARLMLATSAPGT